MKVINKGQLGNIKFSIIATKEGIMIYVITHMRKSESHKWEVFDYAKINNFNNKEK